MNFYLTLILLLTLGFNVDASAQKSKGTKKIKKELTQDEVITKDHNRAWDVYNKKKYSEVTFQFDRVFWTDTKQEALFENVVQPQVDHVLNGYNCCCFACTCDGFNPG